MVRVYVCGCVVGFHILCHILFSLLFLYTLGPVTFTCPPVFPISFFPSSFFSLLPAKIQLFPSLPVYEKSLTADFHMWKRFRIPANQVKKVNTFFSMLGNINSIGYCYHFRNDQLLYCSKGKNHVPFLFYGFYRHSSELS